MYIFLLVYAWVNVHLTCCCSVAKSCLTLCDPMNCRTPDSSVLPEFAQIHVHWVGDAIQLTHHLPPSSPFAFHLPQHQGFFPVSWLFTSTGQSIGASASASVLPMHIQCWFLLGLTDLILLFKGLSIVFSSTTVQKHQLFGAQTSLWSNSHIYAWLLKKTIALTIQIFVSNVISLLFNILSRFVVAFLPRSKHLLILWLQSLSAVILEPCNTNYSFY